MGVCVLNNRNNLTGRREQAARGNMTNESDGLAFGLSNDPDG
jgi:hypothetical protein